MSDAKPWYDEDDFWTTMAPYMFHEQRLAATPTEIDQVIAFLGVPPNAAILDLCCGPGRHSLELARRGFVVTAVDRTAAYLDAARRQAESEGLAVEFLHEDMRLFCCPDAYDGAVNLYTSFGYFEDPADDRRVLANLHRSLRDGGALVMEMIGKEILARNFLERDWHEQEGDLWLQERHISRDWTWIENRWILLKEKARHEFRLSHRIYSAAELSALLTECGFRSVAIYGDLAGAPYDQTARRLVAVARKPETTP